MFVEVNPAYHVAFLFFVVCVGYIGTIIITVRGNPRSKMRSDYVAAVFCVFFSSLFYGLMIIADSETLAHTLWALGFTAYILFYPSWIRFTTNMIEIPHSTIKLIAHKSLLIIITAIFSAVCILSNGAELIKTGYGTQFSYFGSPLFAAAAIYVFILSLGVFAAHIKWWRESKTKRQRRQQFMFVILTFMFAPLGFVNDFFLSAFTHSYVFPLLSILLFPASAQLLLSMNKNKTLNITVPNVSQYVFNSATIPIFVLDYANEVRLFNHATTEFFGCDISGKNVSELIEIDGTTPRQSLLDESFRKDGVTVLTTSGTKICDMVAAVERDKYNDALCKVIILSDITEVERAKNLMESALEQAMAANQAKSNFLSTMSHEMRTPMNAIIGMTKIGKRADSKDEKNHALNRIGEASSHLLGVINDVLDMAKIEADKLVLDPVEYSFERMIKKVVSFINFRVDEKQQVFTVDVDSNIPRFIIGDDLRLAQVLTNLMSNAVKFTPEGGRVFLAASLIGATNDTCELCFKVADSGIGIPYERQTGIFESFEQATDGTSREYGGTGLGLAISKRIVELMGGKIWVESKPGEGAAFSFTVKLQICKKDDIYCSDEDTCDSPMEVGEFVRKRMLLAEDIEVNREIMLSLLEDTGIMIDCVDNGKDAFRIIEESADKYDIVLMDVQMPQMDGLEATRHIRALPDARAAKLPIIAMTANVFKDDIEACLAAGMDGHLGKPIDSDKVMGVLRKYLISESGKAVINTDFHS